MIPPLFGKQEVGIWRVKKRSPRYGVPIWSLWPHIRFLPSIVAEKNVTKNEHICSMCIKINKVGKQEVGIWSAQKRFPLYGVPIWSLWLNIRFLPSTVTEKNVTNNILDGQGYKKNPNKFHYIFVLLFKRWLNTPWYFGSVWVVSPSYQ